MKPVTRKERLMLSTRSKGHQAQQRGTTCGLRRAIGKGTAATVCCCDQQHLQSAHVMSVMNESAMMLKEGNYAPPSATADSSDAIVHEKRRDPPRVLAQFGR